jgi:hypothetical protein
MSFFHRKMSQNLWATIMPFGPVTNILLAQKKKFRASQRLSLISGTDTWINVDHDFHGIVFSCMTD